MICRYYGKDTDPAEINRKLKDKQGFVQGGLYVWDSIEKIYLDLIESKVSANPLNDGHINEIKEAIDAGYPVMLQLDVDPKTVKNDTHYVVCVGYDPSDVNNLTIADPLGGKLRSIKDYLGWFRPSIKETIHQYIIYRGEVPTPYPDTEMGVYVETDVYAKVVGNAVKWEEICNYFEVGLSPDKVSFEDVQKIIAGIKSRNTDLQNQVTLAKSELKNREEQVERLKQQIKLDKALTDRANQLQKQIDALSKEKGSLNNRIAELEVEIKGLNTKITDILKAQAQALSFTDTLLLLMYKVFKVKR